MNNKIEYAFTMPDHNVAALLMPHFKTLTSDKTFRATYDKEGQTLHYHFEKEDTDPHLPCSSPRHPQRVSDREIRLRSWVQGFLASYNTIHDITTQLEKENQTLKTQNNNHKALIASNILSSLLTTNNTREGHNVLAAHALTLAEMLLLTPPQD